MLIALLLYRRCCVCKATTITVPTSEFEILRINRRRKAKPAEPSQSVGLRSMPTPGPDIDAPCYSVVAA
jgi:hypothetical protein